MGLGSASRSLPRTATCGNSTRTMPPPPTRPPRGALFSSPTEAPLWTWTTRTSKCTLYMGLLFWWMYIVCVWRWHVSSFPLSLFSHLNSPSLPPPPLPSPSPHPSSRYLKQQRFVRRTRKTHSSASSLQSSRTNSNTSLDNRGSRDDLRGNDCNVNEDGIGRAGGVVGGEWSTSPPDASLSPDRAALGRIEEQLPTWTRIRSRMSPQMVETLRQLCRDPMNKVVVLTNEERDGISHELDDIPRLGLIAEGGFVYVSTSTSIYTHTCIQVLCARMHGRAIASLSIPVALVVYFLRVLRLFGADSPSQC